MLLTVSAGCASVDTRGPPAAASDFESRSLIYDELVLEFSDPALEMVTASSDDAARNGWSMLSRAPVGCMETGLLYGFCLAVAPFFPVLAASRAQD